MTKIFGFYLESGLLLKNLSDILLLCSEKTCTMDVTENTIEFSRINKSFTENDCKISIVLDSSHLTSFYVLKPISVTIHVKYFNRLCKTLKKKDKVSIWIDTDYSLHIETKEEIAGVQKVEEKEMSVAVLYDFVPTESISTIDDSSYFSNVSFTVSPGIIQSVRKSIGTKASPVEVKIDSDKYLEFNSTWSGAGPLRTSLGVKTQDFKTIIMSAGIINILSKLSQLCNKLKFYQQKDHANVVSVLKVSGKLDNPCYLGEICVLIKETLKKTT